MTSVSTHREIGCILSMTTGMDNPLPAPSPCIGLCVVDRATGYCMGCYRTSQEITQWAASTPRERLEILAALKTRRGEYPGFDYEQFLK